MIPCVVCQSTDFAETPFSYEQIGTVIRIIRCTSCGQGTLRPMISAEQVNQFYGPEYFTHGYRCGLEDAPYTESLESIRQEAKSALSAIGTIAGGRRFLELGCAGGAMLAEARDQGFTTTGVELSASMAEWGRRNLGLDIRTGALADQAFKEREFDVVFLADVIEHLPNPREVVREIHRILSADGVVAVSFPMELNGLIPRLRFLLNLRYKFSGPPYHLQYFDQRTMRTFLEREGFHIVYEKTEKLIRRQSWRTLLTDAIGRLITISMGKFGDRCLMIARKTGP